MTSTLLRRSTSGETQLAAPEPGACHERAELADRGRARRRPQTAVGDGPAPLGRHHAEGAAKPTGHLVRRLPEGLDVDDADRDLTVGRLGKEVQLGHLTVRDLEDELIAARVQERGEQRAVPAEARERVVVEVAEADVE